MHLYFKGRLGNILKLKLLFITIYSMTKFRQRNFTKYNIGLFKHICIWFIRKKILVLIISSLIKIPSFKSN